MDNKNNYDSPMVRISIITVNYNNAVQLEETIKSVVSQTYPDIEYLVIDGGSSDGSKDVIRKYQHQISYWVSEPDGGIYNAMNKAVKVSTGDYCLFLNSGDTLYSSDVIKDCVPQLQADFVCGKANLIYENGSKIWEPSQQVDALFFERRCSLCHQSLFIRTSMLKNRPYQEEYRVVADYEQQFYEIVVNKASYQSLNEIICNYRMDGISSNHSKSDLEKKKIVRLYRALGYIEIDELSALVDELKVGSRKYKMILWGAKLVMNGFKTMKYGK